jgi:UDP-N-acetylmuramate dehydrogenase
MLDIKENISLASNSTFHIGGAARFSVVVSSVDELLEAIAWAKEKKCEWRVLGSGSNLLVSDAGYKGLIIWYRDKTVNVDEESGFVEVGAGALTAVVAGAVARAGLTGFEWAAGVPGTIGGAIYGNAGASGGEIKDSIQEVFVIEKGKMKTYDNAACEFRYRSSQFKKFPAVIVGATMRFPRAENSSEPIEKMKEVLKYRSDTQPKGLASSGCVFKNYEPDEKEITTLADKNIPENFLTARRIPAGWLIEHTDLKGHQIGTAQVSEVHGNFIVNVGDACAEDILKLIDFVRARVEEKFGVHLEEEITILK